MRSSNYVVDVLLASLLLVACGRGRAIWSGAQYVDDKERLMIAAQVGLCGCVTLENRLGGDITVRASHGYAVVGSKRLRPNERVAARFDWAGDSDGDVYVLETTDARGEMVPFAKAVRIRSLSKWSDCSRTSCEFATLGMNIAVTGRVPGEQ
jgi:hypothetical protein